MPEVSGLIKKLEEAPDLEAMALQDSKLRKVFKEILKLHRIPCDEEFRIRERCQLLLARWMEILDDDRPVDADGTQLPSNSLRPSHAVELHRTIQEVAPENTEEMDPIPAVCITQMTPNQCAKVEELAQACDPPLDRSVVELICLLPQFSAQNEHENIPD